MFTQATSQPGKTLQNKNKKETSNQKKRNLAKLFERRSQSDCVHEQVAKRIANVRFTALQVPYFPNKKEFTLYEINQRNRNEMYVPCSGLYLSFGRCINLYIFICKRNPGNGEDWPARFPVWNEMETV